VLISSNKSLVDIPFGVHFECVILDPIATQQNLKITKKKGYQTSLRGRKKRKWLKSIYFL
jgi:hypothetical protein